jgi:hypothetical protein
LIAFPENDAEYRFVPFETAAGRVSHLTVSRSS